MKVIRSYLVSIYREILSYGNKKIAPYILGLLSFSDCAFFIIPPDILLVPMCLNAPKKGFYYALITSIASIFGCMVGYSIGFFAFTYIGEKLIIYFHYQIQFHNIKEFYFKYGPLSILGASYLPVPYLLITIFSGFAKMNFLTFIVLSTLSRTVKFFGYALLFYFFGERAKKTIEGHITKISIVVFLALIILLGYYLTK